MSVTLTSPVVCPVALELSRSTWLVGVLPPNGARVRSFAVRGGNAEGLLERLRAIADRLAVELGRDVELKVGFEAGFDGFWLARFLLQRGVDTLVLDSSSFLVSRRGRRVKTDRIDVEAIAYILRAHLAGDPTVCRLVRIPTPEEEDAKRLSRERTRLASEKTRHVNRIRGLLALHGIRDVKGLWGGEWRAQLDALTTGDGRSLGRFLRAEIAREFERLHLVLSQMKQLEAERHAILETPDSPFPEAHKVHTLKQLAGIGELSATLLVAEVSIASLPTGDISPPISDWRRARMPAATAIAIRASARLATNRRGFCWSRSRGSGFDINRQARSPTGIVTASPTEAPAAARSGSSP
jgi:transposase